MSSFCTAKATHIFSAKNIRILYIESAKTVTEMTLNELVKLTTLWTTGPRYYSYYTPYTKYEGVYTVLSLSIIPWFRHSDFISAWYLEKELMELDQVLHMHWCWPDLGWDYYMSISANIQHSYGLWLLSKFHFCSISFEWNDGIWLNFAYA